MFEILLEYLAALVFFGIYSVLYRDNPYYRLIVAIVIGIASANVLLVNLYSIRDTVLTPIQTKSVGDILWYTAISALIVGIAYFAFFLPRARRVYRFVVFATAGMALGVAVPYSVAAIWGYIKGFGNPLFTSIDAFIMGVAFICVSSYFLFGKPWERPTKPLRDVGRILLIAFAAFCLPQMVLGDINMVQYFLINSVKVGTWWIAIVLFIGILIHILYIRTKAKS